MARLIKEQDNGLDVRKYSLVQFVWLDHASVNRTGVSWPKVEDIKRDAAQGYRSTSVGYLIDETCDYVLISQTLSDDGSCTENLKVLKSCIEGGVKVIRKAKVKK